MKKLLFIIPAALLCWSCTSEKSVAKGPGSETTNGIVALVNGSPAPYAGVALRKVNHVANDGGQENAIVQPDVVADSMGRFALDVGVDEKFRLTVTYENVSTNENSAYSRIYTGEEIAELDTLTLEPTASLTGAADIPEGAGYIWVGVVGMDVFVRSDADGKFALPSLPSNDSLELYFVRDDSRDIFDSVSVKLDPKQVEFVDKKVPVDPKDTVKDTTADLTKLRANFVALFDGEPAAFATAALRDVDFRVDSAMLNNSVVKADAYSDENGNFSFVLPDSGEFRLTIVQPGYAYTRVLDVKDIANLKKIELTSTSNLQSSVALRAMAEFAWVGIYGTDVLVKTDSIGRFTISRLPTNDTLELYFTDEGYDDVYVTEKIKLDADDATNIISPVMMLNDFEDDSVGGDWYFSVDKLGSVAYHDGMSAYFDSENPDYPSIKVAGGDVEDSVQGRVFFGRYMLAMNENAWALFGTSFVDESWNFSGLDSIEFKVKGANSVRVSFEKWDSDSEVTGLAEKAASNWVKTEADKWQRVVFKPSDLCYTAQDLYNCAAAWDVMKTHVHQLHIFVKDGIEIYIDDIKLYGVFF